jgi:hypothetical protein
VCELAHIQQKKMLILVRGKGRPHGCYIAFQTAEVGMSRQIFAGILLLITGYGRSWCLDKR